MKILYITAAALTLGACAYESPTCGLPNEPVVIGTAKDGNLIYDDQAPLSVPCPTVTPPNVSTPPVLIPPVLPPVKPPVKGNNGWGNGDQDAPGRSASRNRAENTGGNRNGRRASPGNSWPKS